MPVVDLRYARALESVVEDEKLSRDVVKRQLDDFVEMYGESGQLREVLEDPSIPQEQKVKFLDALAQRTGTSATVRNFLAVVTAHGRLPELREIVNAYAHLANKDTGIAEAEVTSARPLDDEGRRALEASISQLTGSSTVRASYQEDPALLGGAVVKVGSTVYDGSVRGQLEQLRQRLMTATA